jgi:hypothetical protein
MESGERTSYKAMWHNLHSIAEARKAGIELPPKLSWHSLANRLLPTSWNSIPIVPEC